MNAKSIKLLAFPILVALMSACGHLEPSLEDGRLKDSWSNPSSRRHLRVRGIGMPSKDSTDDTRRRADSREAALAAARRELLALIGGLRLTGGIVVRDAMTIDNELRVTVDRLIFGAEEQLVEWTASGSCVVTLQVERNVVERMIVGVKPKDLPAPLPEPTRKFWKSESKNESDAQWTRADVAGGKSGLARMPKSLLIGGALVPGWAQIFVGQELDGEDSMKMMLKGVAVMGGTLGLLAVAGDNLPQKKGPSHGTAQSTNSRDNRDLAYGCMRIPAKPRAISV